MKPSDLLIVFILLRFCQHIAERLLAAKNKHYFMNSRHQSTAKSALGIDDIEMSKAVAYSLDKYKFSQVSSWVGILITLTFLGFGGLGWSEGLASHFTQHPILKGLVFIGILGVLSAISELPFDLYHTFKLEERHGFNKQTLSGFIKDRIKGTLVGVILGGALIGSILFIMESISNWWAWAWIIIFGFNLVIAWLFPTVLAPLFNKFSPLPEGELKEKLMSLAKKVSFDADSISVMNASIRSSHGNAYFTGIFGKKKIVLFDTLVDSMEPDEICAVLAHELGHFKLHHIRWTMIRSFFITGLVFYGLQAAMPFEPFYTAFALEGVSNYAALAVFSLWFSPLSFLFQPLSTWMSRQNEFAADAFALSNIQDKAKLGDALLKLRQKSHGMPISHPLFSTVYHSHPPLLERLEAMGYSRNA